ncbi:MAG: hydrogenase maturation factor, partial [Clostridiaceae bacterium]|nr:hydrogenase maturation factor [Clostridiaceae bacterium]
MEIGKVPENILKRAVLKQIHHRRPEVILHPGVGEDCSAIITEPDEALVFSVDPITAADKDMGKFAVHITAN